MENLTYKVEISAPAKQVWDTMLQKESYQQWVAKSWPNSFYEGKWAKGEKINWRQMFDDGWPTALQELKKLAERQP